MSDTVTPLTNSVQIVASKLPADNRYGQNGYLGPSSVDASKPQPTASIKATPTDPVLDIVKRDGAAMPGAIVSQQLAPAHGHRNRRDEQHAKVGAVLSRPKK